MGKVGSRILPITGREEMWKRATLIFAHCALGVLTKSPNSHRSAGLVDRDGQVGVNEDRVVVPDGIVGLEDQDRVRPRSIGALSMCHCMTGFAVVIRQKQSCR